jgi:hypothetical protein
VRSAALFENRTKCPAVGRICLCYSGPVSEPSFAQPERRSFLVPIVLALVVLALGLLATRHFFPSGNIEIQQVRTEILPTTTSYKSDSIVVAPTETIQTLFVVSTLKIDNHLRFPVSLEDFTLTLTDNTGAQLTARALQKNDIPNSELSFPALKPLIPAPLVRETVIQPGQSAQGTVLFSLTLPASIWNERKSAAIQVDLYHQAPVTITIPSPD